MRETEEGRKERGKEGRKEGRRRKEIWHSRLPL
jgi:hypothetical protein